jgi:hypothetical protein
MGVILIGVILLIVCIVCAVLYNRTYNDGFFGASILFGFIAVVTLIISIAITLGCQIDKQNHYEKVLYEKSVLEYRLENNINTVGNEMLYNDIIEFNKYLKDVKLYANNFWTNWFNNDLVADIDYIEIDGVETFTTKNYN